MVFYQLDHVVLTVTDIEATCRFYSQVLQISVITFDEARKALQLGHQKINLHPAQAPIRPHAQHPQPGSVDLCLITERPLTTVIDELQAHQVPILIGPVERTGAQSKLLSIYIRDPDGNLIELANVIPD